MFFILLLLTFLNLFLNLIVLTILSRNLYFIYCLYLKKEEHKNWNNYLEAGAKYRIKRDLLFTIFYEETSMFFLFCMRLDKSDF